ncbi:putative lipoprotein [Leptospira borgpetersenii serovar Pomona str. 200901868]|uniref:Putative lipoprotein n=1 Tax=Leptospira borgpetersenii serovar Pomona str. 200901868 TaxID=1192866 RepID=M6VZL7_LEPBO|nr:putative lipoprotein [Leptospira borgpetersenii serovar Pomona str. 200901868]
MKVKIVFSFLFLYILIACNHKKEDTNTSIVLLLAPLFLDRAENYDRDVQIITRTMPPSNQWYTFDLSYSDADLNAYVALLRAQIAKYPRGYWIKAKAEKIYLVKYINGIGGGGARGLSLASENSIYLSVGKGLATCVNCEENYTSTMHHELMHNVDYTQFGPYYSLSVDDWNTLNSSGFQYGSVPNSGAAAAVWTNIIHPLAGFLSYYGTANKLEDRAIYAAAILGGMQQNQSDTLINFCKADPLVAAKSKKIIADMNRFWSFPGAEETFWKRRITETATACN